VLVIVFGIGALIGHMIASPSHADTVVSKPVAAYSVEHLLKNQAHKFDYYYDSTAHNFTFSIDDNVVKYDGILGFKLRNHGIGHHGFDYEIVAQTPTSTGKWVDTKVKAKGHSDGIIIKSGLNYKGFS
jgi:hypothetical protein